MKKKLAVAIGLGMGVVAAFGAMVPTAKEAAATIMVYDERNVNEAIKQAIKTASILSAEEKKLALHVLNTKSLNDKWTMRWIQKQAMANTGCFGEGNDGVEGNIYKQSQDITKVLMNELGSVDKVLNGKATVVDLYKRSQKNHEKLEKIMERSVTGAKKAQEADATLGDVIADGLVAIKNSEGAKQALQTIEATIAANAQMTRNTNYILSQQLAMEAAKNYNENLERATAEQIAQETRDNLAAFVGD